MPAPSPADGFFRYLPADPQAAAFGLAVLACGWTRIAPGSPYPPRRHPPGHHFTWERGRILPELQLIAISRGGGELELPRGTRWRIAAGDAFVLPPGCWHRYRPDPATGWDEHWLAVAGALPERWRAAGLFRAAAPRLTPDPAVAARTVQGMRAIADLVERHPPGYAVAAAGAAAAIAADLLAAAAAADDHPQAAALRAACCRLAARPERPLSVLALAAELGLSERTLRRAFRAATGESPKRWHDRLRLAHAERLIAAGAGIAVAAAACGFRSRSAFARRRAR